MFIYLMSYFSQKDLQFVYKNLSSFKELLTVLSTSSREELPYVYKQISF